MAARLEGKVAIVTGAGQGIGAAIARCFASEGARVIVAEVNPDTGEAMADELALTGVEAKFIQTDVANPESAAAMASKALATFGTPHVLVNNAGVNVFGHPLATSPEDWRRCLAINLEGAWNCSRAILPGMIEAG